nr:carboxypeptidase-like regulatory domain-containing protein [Maribacter sp. ACAM166]
MLYFCFIFAFGITNGQERAVSGTVSFNGSPAPFVNVYLKNTEIGTSSNEDGLYELKNILPGKYTLIASTIGYIPFRTVKN